MVSDTSESVRDLWTDSEMERVEERRNIVRVLGQLGGEHEVPDLYQRKSVQDSFVWAIVRSETGSNQFTLLSYGIGYPTLIAQRLGSLRKLEWHIQDRIASVAFDEAATKILQLLDRETSLRWEELSRQSELEWPDVCRGLSILASAQMCDVGSARVRISEVGDRMLSASQGQG